MLEQLREEESKRSLSNLKIWLLFKWKWSLKYLRRSNLSCKKEISVLLQTRLKRLKIQTITLFRGYNILKRDLTWLKDLCISSTIHSIISLLQITQNFSSLSIMIQTTENFRLQRKWKLKSKTQDSSDLLLTCLKFFEKRMSSLKEILKENLNNCKKRLKSSLKLS